MTEYLARSFELLEALQRTTALVPAQNLAYRLGVNERSVRRLIAGLKEIGIGIESVPGPHGGYQLGPGRRIAPLLPTEAEVVALLAGLSSSAAVSMQGSPVDRELLIQKLSRLLPAKHKATVEDISTYVASYQAAIPSTSAQAVRDLAKYCRLRLGIEIAYSVRGQKQSAQLVEPHHVIQNDYLWYLIAWNQHDDQWQTLRIDRIDSYAATTKNFEPRQLPKTDIAQYTANAIATAPYAYRVEAIFMAPALEVAQRFPIDAIYVEPLDEKSCVVHTGADTFETVAVYLLSADIPFYIRSPEAMREKMRETAHRLEEAASITPADQPSPGNSGQHVVGE